MIGRLLRKECRVINRTQTGADDDYGSPTWVEADPFPALFEHQPISAAELASRTGGKSTERAWFLPATPIGIHARVVTDTEGWEVEGKPRRWVSPLNPRRAYIEVDLVEVE